jgi:microcystin-dependent protein
MSGTNPVGAWALPFSTGGSVDDPTSYKGKIDANFAVAQRVADAFAPNPASPAAMSVVVDAGFTVGTGPSGVQSVVDIGAQTLTIAAAPGAPNNRIDLVVLDEASGTASVVTGTPAGSPVAPALAAGKKQIAQVSVPNGTTSIANGNITDLRAVWQTTVPGVRWAIAGGSADTITASYTPATATLADGLILGFRATAANATTTPSFNADGLGAKTMTKQGGAPLAPGDVPGGLAECMIRYNAANARWELLNPAASSFTTGDVKTTLKTTADAGWVMMNDGTIGDASSGATTRANADTQALFALLWTNVSNTNCPVSSGRGASAAADFASHKTIALPKMHGRALASAGVGSGLTSRALAATVGEETHTLTATEQATMPVSVGVSGGISGSGTLTSYTATGIDDAVIFTGDSSNLVTGSLSIPFSGSFSGSGSGTATGGGTAHNNMQPTSFLNFMIKL